MPPPHVPGFVRAGDGLADALDRLAASMNNRQTNTPTQADMRGRVEPPSLEVENLALRLALGQALNALKVSDGNISCLIRPQPRNVGALTYWRDHVRKAVISCEHAHRTERREMTQDEAKQKWCCGPPGVGQPIDGEESPQTARTCIGSMCMAWRTRFMDQTQRGAMFRDERRLHPEMTDEQLWSRVNSYDHADGYCGLAGKPTS